jgi:hypothetical protein
MPEIAIDPPLPSCYHCFPHLESKNINNLVLIPSPPRARAFRAMAGRLRAMQKCCAGSAWSDRGSYFIKRYRTAAG